MTTDRPIPLGVWPERGISTLVHLYVPGYVSPSGRNRLPSMSLCNGTTTTGTKRSPRTVMPLKVLREPYHWCPTCVGRWLELDGQLAQVMQPAIRRAQYECDKSELSTNAIESGHNSKAAPAGNRGLTATTEKGS